MNFPKQESMQGKCRCIAIICRKRWGFLEPPGVSTCKKQQNAAANETRCVSFKPPCPPPRWSPLPQDFHRGLRGNETATDMQHVCAAGYTFITKGGLALPVSPGRSLSSAHLTEEGDWLLAHGMSISDVGFDDLSEGLLHSLETWDTKRRFMVYYGLSGCNPQQT